MANLIDHLVYRAHFDPKAIALQDLERQLTFGQLFFLVKRFSSKLRQAGIKPGDIVITSFLDNYLDWIITLALFHEATITCSNHGYAPIDNSIDYDWVITDRADLFEPGKTILVDNDWVADAQNQSYEIDQFNYESNDSVPRLILTSGTTGQTKVVPWNIGVCNVQVI